MNELLPRIGLLAFTTLLFGVALGYFLGYGHGASTAEPEITSFEECVAAGYPVMESYPEQCRTPDGKLFVREIEEEPETPEVQAPANPPAAGYIPRPQEPVACTMDAKVCPDGSAVGRTGPNCTFPPCPGE